MTGKSTALVAAQGLLILIVPPSLEEALVDYLLLRKDISGFTSNKVHGHGRLHGDVNLSIIEQVSGRQARMQFMTHAAVEDLQLLVTDLKQKFRSSDIHYILLPILAC